MTNQPLHPTERPPTLQLGPGRHIYPDPPLAGLTEEQQRWAALLSTERDIWTVTDIMRGSDRRDHEILDDWKNQWLIKHQDSLWIYEFTDEEKREAHGHLKQLRAAGHYSREFVAFEEYRAREEWGC